jgi:hypothetical protein
MEIALGKRESFSRTVWHQKRKPTSISICSRTADGLFDCPVFYGALPRDCTAWRSLIAVTASPRQQPHLDTKLGCGVFFLTLRIVFRRGYNKILAKHPLD